MGGRFNHLPAAAVAATLLQGRVVAAAAAEAAAAAASAVAARSHSDPDLGSNEGGLSGGGPPRGMDCGWGDHPHWVVRSGPPGGVLVGGTRMVPGPSPIPGVAWLLLGTLSSGGGSLRTTRKRWPHG